MKSDQQLDTLLKQAVNEKLKDTTIQFPDSQPTWQKIESALLYDEQRIPRRRLPIWRVGWVAAIIIAILFITGIPQNTTAFTKLFHILDEWKDDVIRIVSKSPDHNEGEALTPPPKKDHINSGQSSGNKRIVSLEEAKQQVSFTLKLPKNAENSGYTLTRVSIWPNNNNQKSDLIRLEYEGEHGQFNIIEERLYTRYTQNQEVDGEVEEIMIGENVGILVASENGFLSLVWIDEGLSIDITGLLTREDIIAVAKSLK